jgi:hypothetical protein
MEGLWEQDIAECFLLDRRTGHYTEYNLSPGGAWWAAHFTAPRIRLVPQPTAAEYGVRTSGEWTATGWTGRMELPLPDMSNHFINFTAITARSGIRHYASLAPLGGEKPDFHRPQDWLPCPE